MNKYLIVALLAIELVICSIDASSDPKHSLEAHVCRLLETKYIDSQPWIEYPIIYQPITRGRLTVWSGISTLPSSEFECQVDTNNTIRLNFVNFSEKLEWTFFDMKRRTTYNGISVNQRENVEFKVTIRPAESYLDCNAVGTIEFARQGAGKDSTVGLKSTCRDCDQSILQLINNQIKQLMKSNLDQQIVDNLQWHLTELISSQHSTGPIHYES